MLTDNASFLRGNKKAASRKAARKQARLEKKARRSKSQEGLLQRPLEGHGDGSPAPRGPHGPGKRKWSSENPAGESASGHKGSSQMLHTGSKQPEVHKVVCDVVYMYCVCWCVRQ